MNALSFLAVIAGFCWLGQAQAATHDLQAEARRYEASQTLCSKPRSMTFVQAVEAGLAYQYKSALAGLEVQRARGLSREALAQALPTLTANGVYSHIDHARTLAGRVLQPDMQLNGNVALVIPLLNGRAWGNVQEAHAHERLVRVSREAARREVAISVALGYLDAIEQEQLAEVLQSSVATNHEHFRFAKESFDGGVGNRLDMLRADEELATSQVQWLHAKVSLLAAREMLGRLTGFNGPVVPVDEMVLPEPQLHGDAIATLTQRRSDLQAMLQDVLFTQKLSRNTYLDFLPTLLGSAQVFGQTPPSPTVPTFGWQAQLLLNVPLYDGGARYGRIKQHHEEANMALLRLDDGTRTARSEVRVAMMSAESSEQALIEAERAALQAGTALALASHAYKRGLSQNLQVIDAERRSRDAAIGAARARNALRRAQLQLMAAAGQFPGPI